MNEAEVRRRIAGLRDAGAELRARPARHVWKTLASVVDDWRREDSPWRAALERELPRATGFTSPVVAEGLRVGLESWTGERFRALVERELAPAADGDGGSVITGFPVTSVLLAGAIPMPTLLSLLAPLALRSPVVAKAASRDPVTPRLVMESVRANDAVLGRCLDVLTFAGSDDESMRPLLEADCVVATGSDATVAAVAARVGPPRRCVLYGHRTSAAVVGPAALRGEARAGCAGRLALDVALWDQLGCLSPTVAIVVGTKAEAEDFAAATADALADRERSLPRGEIDVESAALVAAERSEAELRAAAGHGVTVHAGAGSSYTVICEDSPAPRPVPGHRFLRVAAVPDAAATADALRPLGAHLAAVGVEGFAGGTRELAAHLAGLGASRVCALGRMQAPPLAWHHDNRSLFEPLARYTDLEAGV